MARYDKSKIFKQAQELATKHKLLFVQDIIDFLPLSTSTFYEYFPAESEQMEILRKILDENKVAIKASLRARWYHSDNATLQMALYRLTATADEHRVLNQHYIAHDIEGQLQVNLIDKSTDEDS
jgi:hypothetical protein